MIHYKSRHNSGSTLVEVIIALVMIAIVVGVLLATQAQTVRAVGQSEHEVVVMMALKERLAEVDLHGFSSTTLPAEMPLPDYCPVGTLKYTSRRPSGNSSLNKLSGIRIDMVRAEWGEGDRKFEREIVRYVYAPEGVQG